MYERAKREAQMIKEGIDSNKIKEVDKNIEGVVNRVIIDTIEEQRKSNVIVNETKIDAEIKKIFADILGFEV